MDGPKLSAAPTSTAPAKAAEKAPSVVFQPQKLKEIVEVVDLMGTVASRVREDSSGDLPGSGAAKAAQKAGITAREEAIAKAPPVEIMQQKLVQHLREERSQIQRQARAVAKSNQPGAAWTLAELYRKIRRLSSLITQILQASAEMVKRFYVSAFIDRQPLVVTGGSIVQSDQ
jgi:hypothetical protein